MKYPNRIQAALLFDDRFDGLDGLVRDFARIAQMKSGAIFTITEHRPGSFVRLVGGVEDLMLTFECIDAPPLRSALVDALASPVTSLTCADMPERVARAHRHILLDASHSVLGGIDDEPRFAGMFQQLGTAPTSAGASAFVSRLETLALMARVAIDHVNPVAVHWTQSNRLLDAEAFEAMAAMGFPGPLAIHPLLFGTQPTGAEPEQIGLRTFGARHWLGREIVIPQTALPWSAAYRTALAFIEMASGDPDRLFADGDTFGSEDASELWRVHQREGEADDAASGIAANDDADARGGSVPIYELIPLRHDASGFVAEDQPPAAAIPAEPLRLIAPGADANADAEPDPEPDADWEPGWDDEPSSLAELQAALAEGRAAASANPPDPLPAALIIATPSQPGSITVTGRTLRARVFGARENGNAPSADT